MKRFRRLLPVILILLVAFLLRSCQLTEIPPGLTHDEANHGREAIGILGGNLALFFPLNYGSEPLYSYTVAGHMLLLGKRLLALRLVNVFFGLLAVAATYRWAALVFDRTTARLAAALMALSFWPLASSREALRAGMMPFFTVGSMLFFWLMVRRAQTRINDTSPAHRGVSTSSWSQLLLVAGFTLCLTATLYNYLAARALWLVFPLFLLYLALVHRPLLKRLWRPTSAGLLGTGLLVTPMFVYLQRHPAAQTRLQMFGGTLQDVTQGNLAPLVEKAGRSLLAFVWPGFGDQFLAYNIPGRPVFEPLSALLFVAGIAVCLWRWRRPATALLLAWFVVGIAPSLLTGPTANTTRNVGAMPAVYILPALGFVALARRIQPAAGGLGRTTLHILAVAWLAFAGWRTATDYFVRWAASPDVRAAYQHTLVEELAHLERTEVQEPVVISSVYPGAAHNPSIGLVLAPEAGPRRWVDARTALIFPSGSDATLVVPAATPLHEAFTPWVERSHTVQLQPNDLNPSFTVYRLTLPQELPNGGEPVVFGRQAPALTLLDGRWLSETVQAGGVAELLQVWRVEDPAGAGPVIPGIEATDVVFFTHVVDASGSILAQQDRLDAPSWDWQAGDIVVQIHQIEIPAEAPPGSYETRAGVYDRRSIQPLPVLSGGDEAGETRAAVDPLNIIP